MGSEPREGGDAGGGRPATRRPCGVRMHGGREKTETERKREQARASGGDGLMPCNLHRTPLCVLSPATLSHLSPPSASLRGRPIYQHLLPPARPAVARAAPAGASLAPLTPLPLPP